MTLASRHWKALGRLVLFVGLVAFSYRYMDLLGDSFWSVATGDLMLDRLHGGASPLPPADPFAFTTSAREWVVHMPLTQVLFALLHRMGTLHTLMLGGAFVHAIALVLLVEPYVEGPVERLAGFFLALGLVLLQEDDLCVRGQLFGDVGFSVLLLLLSRIRSERSVPWWVPVALGSLWINLHSSYFLAFCLPLFVAVLAYLEPSERRHAGPLVRFATSAFVGSFLNPYGYRLPLDLLRLLFAKTTSEIDLFRPPDLHDPHVVAAFVFLFAVASVHLWIKKPGPDALVLIVLTCASASGRRYLPLACAYGLVMVLRTLGTAKRAAPSPNAFHLGLLVAALLVAAFGFDTKKDPLRDVPSEETAMIERLGLPDNVANLYHWGGYLDFAWRGRRKVLVDGRNQLFEDGAFEAAARLARVDHASETLTAYRINTVVWERGSALDVALRQNSSWRLVHEGRIAVLYTRVTPIKVARPGSGSER